MARLLLVAMLLFCGNWAGAEPITVTSGRVVFTDEPGAFSLAGSGFSFEGGWFPTSVVTGTFWFDRCGNDNCQPGAPVDFGTTTYGSSSAVSGEILSGTIGGVFFPELFLESELSFNGPRVVAPLDGGPFNAGMASAPFTMQGHVAVYERLSTNPLFVADLNGSGTAFVWFHGSDFHSGFEVDPLEYVFDQEPIPEPSTVLLVATGLAAGVAGATRRRRQRLSAGID